MQSKQNFTSLSSKIYKNNITLTRKTQYYEFSSKKQFKQSEHLISLCLKNVRERI